MTTTPDNATADPAPKLYAVLELFGHQRIAGKISEQTFGGASFVRVDVPEVTVKESRYEDSERVSVTRLIAAHTRSFGSAAIYSINWCDEETALIAAIDIRHEPLQPYSVREAINNLPDVDRHRLLTSHRQRDLTDDDDDDKPF